MHNIGLVKKWQIQQQHHPDGFRQMSEVIMNWIGVGLCVMKPLNYSKTFGDFSVRFSQIGTHSACMSVYLERVPPFYPCPLGDALGAVADLLISSLRPQLLIC